MDKSELILKLIGLLTNDVTPEEKATGEYVIVRCRDAGVHAGYLISASGRTCKLRDSRRLWYWKPADGAAFLSGVAAHGLHNDSKVGCRVDITLTENCEIIKATAKAQNSIEAQNDYTP